MYKSLTYEFWFDLCHQPNVTETEKEIYDHVSRCPIINAS